MKCDLEENIDWEEIERIEKLCEENGIQKFIESDEEILEEIRKLVEREEREEGNTIEKLKAYQEAVKKLHGEFLKEEM